MRRTKVITVCLPAEVARAIKARAKSEGCTVSRYMRALIQMDFLDANKPVPFPLPPSRLTVRPLRLSESP
jgi:hypothetical protein